MYGHSDMLLAQRELQTSQQQRNGMKLMLKCAMDLRHSLTCLWKCRCIADVVEILRDHTGLLWGSCALKLTELTEAAWWRP